MPYVIGALIVAAIVGGLFWWRSRQSGAGDEEHQMLSFVALLREPCALSDRQVAQAANLAWGADLSWGDVDTDEELEKRDGFVVGQEGLPMIMVQYQQRMMIVNNFREPYLDDPDAAAESIPDLRLRNLLKQHKAWISCDAMGVESFEDADEVRDWYRLLGPLLAELVDDNCLAILIPQTSQLFPNMDETLQMLKSDDPLEALMDDAPPSIVPIGEDDPRMKAAVAEARANWPRFVADFHQKAGENFSIKAPLTHGDNVEFIWISVNSIADGKITGELANDPMDLGPLKLGSIVTVPESTLNDWAYVDSSGEPHGMYTVKVLSDAARENQE